MLKIKANGRLILKDNKLSCGCCCDFDLPTILWRSRSASKTKQGFRSGICVPPTTCFPSCDGYYLIQRYVSTSATTFDWSCVSTPPYFEPFAGGPAGDQVIDPDTGAVTDNRTGSTSPRTRVELHDEYTTAILITRTEDALPGDWPNSTAGSYRNLATNEVTFQLRESEWRILLPSDLETGKSYRLYYTPVFTPISGSPTTGAETYLEISGDDAGEYTEWQSIAVPEANGTNSLVFTRWECL